MARAQRGDREAYRALLEDVGPLIARFMHRHVREPADAEDACQEALLALHRARHTYEPARPIEPWLFAIARNVATDFARRRRRRALREVVMDIIPEPVVEPERDVRTRFQHALGRLPTAQRDALVMLKAEGLSVAEAAARAGTTTGALKVRAHRAYVALKSALGR
jgi:RNA polymerase sigma-70 factor (ECF subfamily)